MNLAHIIQQLQEAHAKLGNHPNARLVIDSRIGYDYAELFIQDRDARLDFAKQTVYLPVTSNNTNP